MSGPNSWYEGANAIYTGVHAATAVPAPLAGPLPGCRKITLVAAAGAAAFVLPQGQPAGVGFPIPAMPADGALHTLEFWVSDPSVLWIQGTGNIYWLAELQIPLP